MSRRLVVLVTALVTALFVIAPVATAQESLDRSDRALPQRVADLRLDTPVLLDGISAPSLDQSLVGATGRQQVIIHLTRDSVAESGAVTDGQQVRQKNLAAAQQRAFERRLARLDRSATTLGSVQRVLNAVFAEVDGAQLDRIAADRAVERIAPVGTYQLDLSETVPYIGAAAVQAGGVDGSGISVAVLDSGIDYTHAALGGSGDPAEYAANDPSVIEPGTFPTHKVVGGYDFVGSDWDGSDTTPPEAPDPDPLDDGPEAGHGTHVGDIIGGNLGVAPGVDLYGVKVCSSRSTACSGIALIQGMEFAADPNMDGKTKDHVDIVNMSLGSNYGQPFDDDLTAAVDAATALGILTVASSGNSSDKPYVTGTPGAARTALSVAQTAVPSAVLPLMDVTAPASIAGLYPAVFQPWSVPLSETGPIGPAPLIYGDGAGGNLDGCAPFDTDLSGNIVLVDRGSCNFTLKISNIGQAGGLVGIIGLIAPGDPFSGGDGGDRPIDIPGFMVLQSISNTLKSGLPDTMVAFDPATGLPEIMSMVGSSSRGPSNYYQQIKPEIGAPGASVSAIAGSGTGTGPFGGTSGAAPMVTGSAALLLDGFATNQQSNGKGKAKGLDLSPAEVKALLMNNAETNIVNNVLVGSLAPITRIGGGEVRVDRAMAAPAAAWDANAPQGALSFGMVEVDGTTTLTRTVRVHNYSNRNRTYSITPTFRFDDDAASGAVSVSVPSSIRVRPGLGSDAYFDVTLTIDGSKLPGNYMNSGSNGASGDALALNEYDGYLVLDDGSHTMHVPWQVLPRQAAHVTAAASTFAAGSFPATIGLDNAGVGTAQNDAYSLLATSDMQPPAIMGAQAPMPDLQAVGINTFPVPAGFCSGEESFIWAFAADTYGEQSHVLPVSHQFWLDTDQDGTSDYVVLNRDVTYSSTSDGRNLAWAVNLATGDASAFFFTEHATNTGNTVLYICGEQVGLTGTDMLATNVDMFVVTQDWYFGGGNDTSVTGLTVTPLGEQYYGSPAGDIAGGESGSIDIYDFGPFPGNSPELGVMLLTNGDRGSGARGGATDDTETLYFFVE